MIRSTRFFLFGINKLSVSHRQGAILFPSQNLAEFCDLAGSKLQNKKPKPHGELFPTELKEKLKYSILTHAFKGNTADSDLFRNQFALNSFLEKVGSYNVHNIIWVLKMFADSGIRQKIVIQVLCDTLVSKSSTFNAKECSDLLFSLSKLSIRHEPLIKMAVEQLKNQNEAFKSSEILKSVAHSVTCLRHRDLELLDLALEAVLRESNQNPKVPLNVLIALGWLNYCPNKVDTLIESLQCLEETDFHFTKEYVDFVWACVLLNKHDYIVENHLPKILSTSFIEFLQNKSVKFNEFSSGMKLKILNLNAIASQLQSYKGPTLKNNLKFFSIYSKNQKDIIHSSISDSLHHIINRDGSLQSFVDTKAGFILDIECCVNSKASTKTTDGKQGTKLGIIIMKYKDTCSDGESTGLFTFKVNILKGLGYKTIVIPYYDFPINSKLSEKIFYVQKKIESAMNSDDDMVKRKTLQENV